MSYNIFTITLIPMAYFGTLIAMCGSTLVSWRGGWWEDRGGTIDWACLEVSLTCIILDSEIRRVEDEVSGKKDSQVREV